MGSQLLNVYALQAIKWMIRENAMVRLDPNLKVKC
jgi:hypothetical protein